VLCGTREEPGTFTQGASVFPGSSRLGIEPKTPGWLVQDPTTRPIGDLIPTIVSESIDRPFIVLTETKSSYRHIPVWARYSPVRLRVGRACLGTDFNGGRHVTLSSRVQREDHIRVVPVGLNLGDSTSRLENPVRIFVIVIEDVA
jgi:hypothetical protein